MERTTTMAVIRPPSLNHLLDSWYSPAFRPWQAGDCAVAALPKLAKSLKPSTPPTSLMHVKRTQWGLSLCYGRILAIAHICRRLARQLPTAASRFYVRNSERDEMARRTPDPYEGRSPEQLPHSRLLNLYVTSLPAQSSQLAPARKTRGTRTSWLQYHSLVCSSGILLGRACIDSHTSILRSRAPL